MSPIYNATAQMAQSFLFLFGGQQQFFASCDQKGEKLAKLCSAAARMCDDVTIVLQMNGNLDYEQVMPIIRERPF